MSEPRQSRAKAWAAEVDAARRRAGLTLPDGLTERAAWLGRLLSEWAIAEVAPGRLLPWLPVAYGFGIVVYFTADREPASWAAAALALAGIVAAFWRAGARSVLPLRWALPPSPPGLRPPHCKPCASRIRCWRSR